MIKNSNAYRKVQTKKLTYGKYQRPIKESWRDEIVQNFDEGLLGTLIVSYRNGKYYVLDGQHRLEAAKIKGINNIMCQIHEGLSYEDEARLFNQYNKKRKPLKPSDIFRASLEAQDFKALDIKRIVEKNNFSITFSSSKSDNKITAIATLENIYNSIGAEGLDKTLRIINKAWDGEKLSLSRKMLNGISYFIKLYNSGFKEDHLIKKLNVIAPTVILREGDADSKYVSTGRNKSPYAKAIWGRYNKGRQQKYRLENKFQ